MFRFGFFLHFKTTYVKKHEYYGKNVILITVFGYQEFLRFLRSNFVQRSMRVWETLQSAVKLPNTIFAKQSKPGQITKTVVWNFEQNPSTQKSRW